MEKKYNLHHLIIQMKGTLEFKKIDNYNNSDFSTFQPFSLTLYFIEFLIIMKYNCYFF